MELLRLGSLPSASASTAAAAAPVSTAASSSTSSSGYERIRPTRESLALVQQPQSPSAAVIATAAAAAACLPSCLSRRRAPLLYQVRTLFGNVEQLRDLAQQLLQELDLAVKKEEHIGPVFVRFAPLLK